MLVAAGCSLRTSEPSDAPFAGASTSGPDPGAATSPATTTPADPDTALVADVLQQLSVTHHVVRENRTAHPDLTQRLRPLERLHAAHARELGALVPVTGRVARPGDSDEQTLSRVDTAEARLQKRLVRAAVAAESGAVAQVLAAMAAAVAQARAVL